jgi:hypothetical protein
VDKLAIEIIKNNDKKDFNITFNGKEIEIK